MVYKLSIFLLIVAIAFLVGCSGMRYESPTNGKITYWRTAGMNSDLISGEDGSLKISVTGQKSVDPADILAKILADALKAAAAAPK